MLFSVLYVSCLVQHHSADELFSRSKCCAGLTRDCSKGVATWKKYTCHVDRHRPRSLRSKWRIRSTSRRLEHNLGRKSEARSRYLGVSTSALPLLCNGCRYLFSAARLNGTTSHAEDIQ